MSSYKVLIEYMKANFAHDLRTPFSAINVSLNSLQNTFPLLMDGYIKALNAGLIEENISEDYLLLIEKSIKNSLIGIKFCDNYLNNLLLLLEENTLNQGTVKICSLYQILTNIFSNESEQYHLNCSSVDDFSIAYNILEFESCLKVLIEDMTACKNEQQAKNVVVFMNKVEKKLTFEILKSKINSRIADAINAFKQGNFQQRYGLGFYVFSQMLINHSGEIKLVETPDSVQFLIKF